MIYLQVVFGAVLRHTGARLDAHLIIAGLVALHVVLLGARVLRSHPDRPGFFLPAALLLGLLLLQLALGLGAYLGKYTMILPPSWVVVVGTSHVVTGALMLAASLILTLRSYGHLARQERPQEKERIALGTAHGSERISA